MREHQYTESRRQNMNLQAWIDLVAANPVYSSVSCLGGECAAINSIR